MSRDRCDRMASEEGEGDKRASSVMEDVMRVAKWGVWYQHRRETSSAPEERRSLKVGLGLMRT
jgi:hypothetical protein